MDLPEYRNIEQVQTALKEQGAVIAKIKAELHAAEAVRTAIRTMCPHKYTKRYSCGRDAGNKCDICGDWQ